MESIIAAQEVVGRTRWIKGMTVEVKKVPKHYKLRSILSTFGSYGSRLICNQSDDMALEYFLRVMERIPSFESSGADPNIEEGEKLLIYTGVFTARFLSPKPEGVAPLTSPLELSGGDLSVRLHKWIEVWKGERKEIQDICFEVLLEMAVLLGEVSAWKEEVYKILNDVIAHRKAGLAEGEKDLLCAEAQAKVGRICIFLARFVEGCRLLEESVKVLVTPDLSTLKSLPLTAFNVNTLTLLEELGVSYFFASEWEMGKLVMESTIHLTEQVYGKKNKRYIGIALAYAVRLMEIGRIENACPLLRQIISLSILSGLDIRDIDVQKAYLCLSNGLVRIGRIEDAERYMISCLQNYRQLIGVSDVRYTHLMQCLAEVCLEKNHVEDAYFLFMTCKRIRYSSPAHDPSCDIRFLSDIFPLENAIIAVYIRKGRFRKALSLAQALLVQLSKRSLLDDPIYGTCCSDMGHCYFNLKQFEMALEWHRKALHTLGPEENVPSVERAMDYERIGACYLQLEDFKEAEVYYQKSLQCYLKAVGQSGSFYCALLGGLVKTYIGLEDIGTVTSYISALVQAAEDSNLEKSHQYYRYVKVMGMYEAAVGNRTRAVECFSQAIGMMKLIEEYHPNLIGLWDMLSEVSSAALQEALDCKPLEEEKRRCEDVMNCMEELPVVDSETYQVLTVPVPTTN